MLDYTVSLIGQDWFPSSRAVYWSYFPVCCYGGHSLIQTSRVHVQGTMHIIRIVRGPLGSPYTPTCALVSYVVLVSVSSGILNGTAQVDF